MTVPRSVKIDPQERAAWTSDRPRRDGEEPRPRRPADISVRCRVLAPADRMRYSPGSLLLVVGPDAEALDALVARVVEEQGAVLGLGKLRALLAGKVAPEQVEAKAAELRFGVAARRLAAGDAVVATIAGLDPADREPWARLAAGHRRPRHLMFVDTRVEGDDPELAAAANALRRALDAGELGAEGFATAVRLSGQAAAERRRVVFAPPPAD